MKFSFSEIVYLVCLTAVIAVDWYLRNRDRKILNESYNVLKSRLSSAENAITDLQDEVDDLFEDEEPELVSDEEVTKS